MIDDEYVEHSSNLSGAEWVVVVALLLLLLIEMAVVVAAFISI